jgi:hypothetical protein
MEEVVSAYLWLEQVAPAGFEKASRSSLAVGWDGGSTSKSPAEAMPK